MQDGSETYLKLKELITPLLLRLPFVIAEKY